MSTQFYVHDLIMYAFQVPTVIFPPCCVVQSLTSAWLPAARVLLHLSQRRQGRCQFLPRDDTFSAAETQQEKSFPGITPQLLHPRTPQHPCANTNVSVLTKIHCLVAPRADVGSSWEGGEARGWRKENMNHFSSLRQFPWCLSGLIRFSSSLPAVPAPAPLLQHMMNFYAWWAPSIFCSCTRGVSHPSLVPLPRFSSPPPVVCRLFRVNRQPGPRRRGCHTRRNQLRRCSRLPRKNNAGFLFFIFYFKSLIISSLIEWSELAPFGPKRAA